MGMLSQPDDVLTDTDVVGRVAKVLGDGRQWPAVAPPSREQLEAALATTTSVSPATARPRR
jgi:hypothetical protein